MSSIVPSRLDSINVKDMLGINKRDSFIDLDPEDDPFDDGNFEDINNE